MVQDERDLLGAQNCKAGAQNRAEWWRFIEEARPHHMVVAPSDKYIDN